MYRGTTPTLRFTLPFDTSTLDVVGVTIAQGGKVIINKEKSDCDLKGKDISVTLTQAETLALTAGNKTEIQLRVLTTDGLALASEIFRENTDYILKDGVIE